MSPIRVVTDAWPLVVHVSEGTPSDAEIDAYIHEATEVLRRGVPHVAVMDASALAVATPYARARKKAWLAENGELLRASCRATALVLTSPLARFAAATVMLVRPFPTPYRIFATRKDAEAWALAQLEADAAPSGQR
jgi:hypothetical protein